MIFNVYLPNFVSGSAAVVCINSSVVTLLYLYLTCISLVTSVHKYFQNKRTFLCSLLCIYISLAICLLNPINVCVSKTVSENQQFLNRKLSNINFDLPRKKILLCTYFHLFSFRNRFFLTHLHVNYISIYFFTEWVFYDAEQ